MVQLHVTQSSVIRYLNSSSQVKESLNGQTFFVAKMGYVIGGYAYSEEFKIMAALDKPACWQFGQLEMKRPSPVETYL